ncbi:hypothetical protein BLNAU_7552 [Blattamonas nauphoetae]|uniref:t-SNARE coiled-coil homology domain-containing protein n=1 Tax=Blattamonas nauphoetae TaxID=2049346 RepID=A0ABQ9Y0Y0_9EUKA|nr:hypothetical protein BLNAU_7552 [Blattamonas nauphoetae]
MMDYFDSSLDSEEAHASIILINWLMLDDESILPEQFLNQPIHSVSNLFDGSAESPNLDDKFSLFLKNGTQIAKDAVSSTLTAILSDQTMYNLLVSSLSNILDSLLPKVITRHLSIGQSTSSQLNKLFTIASNTLLVILQMRPQDALGLYPLSVSFEALFLALIPNFILFAQISSTKIGETFRSLQQGSTLSLPNGINSQRLLPLASTLQDPQENPSTSSFLTLLESGNGIALDSLLDSTISLPSLSPHSIINKLQLGRSGVMFVNSLSHQDSNAHPLVALLTLFLTMGDFGFTLGSSVDGDSFRFFRSIGTTLLVSQESSQPSHRLSASLLRAIFMIGAVRSAVRSEHLSSSIILNSISEGLSKIVGTVDEGDTETYITAALFSASLNLAAAWNLVCRSATRPTQWIQRILRDLIVFFITFLLKGSQNTQRCSLTGLVCLACLTIPQTTPSTPHLSLVKSLVSMNVDALIDESLKKICLEGSSRPHVLLRGWDGIGVSAFSKGQSLSNDREMRHGTNLVGVVFRILSAQNSTPVEISASLVPLIKDSVQSLLWILPLSHTSSGSSELTQVQALRSLESVCRTMLNILPALHIPQPHKLEKSHALSPSQDDPTEEYCGGSREYSLLCDVCVHLIRSLVTYASSGVSGPPDQTVRTRSDLNQTQSTQFSNTLLKRKTKVLRIASLALAVLDFNSDPAIDPARVHHPSFLNCVHVLWSPLISTVQSLVSSWFLSGRMDGTHPLPLNVFRSLPAQNAEHIPHIQSARGVLKATAKLISLFEAHCLQFVEKRIHDELFPLVLTLITLASPLFPRKSASTSNDQSARSDFSPVEHVSLILLDLLCLCCFGQKFEAGTDWASLSLLPSFSTALPVTPIQLLFLEYSSLSLRQSGRFSPPSLPLLDLCSVDTCQPLPATNTSHQRTKRTTCLVVHQRRRQIERDSAAFVFSMRGGVKRPFDLPLYIPTATLSSSEELQTTAVQTPVLCSKCAANYHQQNMSLCPECLQSCLCWEMNTNPTSSLFVTWPLWASLHSFTLSSKKNTHPNQSYSTPLSVAEPILPILVTLIPYCQSHSSISQQIATNDPYGYTPYDNDPVRKDLLRANYAGNQGTDVLRSGLQVTDEINQNISEAQLTLNEHRTILNSVDGHFNDADASLDRSNRSIKGMLKNICLNKVLLWIVIILLGLAILALLVLGLINVFKPKK